MKTPFSVLMSLYIKEVPLYLEDCLKSLKQQTLHADEIIIVLDGPISSDLQTVLDKWVNQLPLNIYPQQRNQGLGKALNIGLEHCKHERVFRMDTDDICTPDRFEVQSKYLDLHPKIDILSCYISEFNITPNDSTSLRKVPASENIKRYSTFRNPINHMGVVFKKSKIIEAGGYKHLHFMEDYYLWIRCIAKKYIIDNIEKPLIYARTGNGMLERRKGYKYIKSEYRLAKLKKVHLKISTLECAISLIIRAAPRLLSSKLLAAVYKKARLPIK